MESHHRAGRRTLRGVLGILVWLIALSSGLTSPLAAADPNWKVCFPNVINTPDTWGQPPLLTDNDIAGDRGWTSAWRYVHMNGTPQNDVIIQTIHDASFLYFSFDVNRLTGFSASDFLQVVIDPNSDTLHRYMFHPTNGAGAAQPGSGLLYHTRPAAGGVWTPGPALGGATIAAHTIPGSLNSWRVELKIPRGAPVNVPAGPATFGLYMNATLAYSSSATEYVWPNHVGVWLEGDPDNTPATSAFGTASLGGAPCNGVYIQPADITTTNSPPSKIATNGVNTFRAVAHNAMTNGAGALVPANNVSARFRLADFGISSAWANIPWTGAKPNPTAPQTIPAGGTALFEMTWDLTPAESTHYSQPAHRHQCVLVELDASQAGPGTSVVFSNKSAWTNMNFGTASTFDGIAVIDARGYGRMAAPGPRQRMDLVVGTMSGRALEAAYPEVRELLGDRQISTMMRERAPQEERPVPGRVTTRYMKLVHGCLRSGRFIRIRGTRYEICGRAGSYGYLVAHQGARAATFRETLRPVPGREVALRAVETRELSHGKRAFQLDLPTDGVVELASTIEAEDTPVRPDTRRPPGRAPGCGEGGEAGGGGFAALLLVGWLRKRRRSAADATTTDA